MESTISSRTRGVRQPVSCEPCRKRKIKCSRTRTPCNTCSRRQCPESCVYLVSPKDSPEPNRELLARIDNLEEMLRKHTGASQSEPQSAGQNNACHDSALMPAMLSPPTDTLSQSYGLSPESLNYDLVHRQSESSFSPLSPTVQPVGELRSSAAGNVQYEPRSAQWTAVLANTGITVPMLDDVQEVDESAPGFPFSAGQVPSRDELLAMLPPMRHCDYLKGTYFDVFSPLFHILHDPSFDTQYEAFVNDVSTASDPWLAVLFVILSLAVTSLDENDPVLRDLARGSDPSNIRLLSRRYREAAMKCLVKQGVFRGKHNVESLQALILLGYAMSHSQEPIWILLGVIYQVAMAVACHIDPSNFDLNPIQCEERRRCWAGLLMLYTIQNAFLGNPDTNGHLSLHSVQLPVDANDMDITTNGIHLSVTGPTQVTYLLFKFQLYGLTASICQEIFRNSSVSRQAISALDQQICLAQESWDVRYAVDSATGPLPANHKMHLHILHAYAHQLFLLLHRPFFAQSVMSLDAPNESQIRCIASSEALLDIHQVIHETPEYSPYLWYSNGLGSFHAFHAAVVLAVAMLMPLYKLQHEKFRRILEDTLERFEKMKGRSVICRRGARVLRVLLTVPYTNKHSQPLRFNTSEATHSSTAQYLRSSKIPIERLSNDEVYADWDVRITDQLHFLAERLQPEQWLSPTSIAWNEWDKVLLV